MEQALTDEICVQRVREVVRVDGGIGEWVSGRQVDGAAGEGVFQNGEEGEIIIRIGGTEEVSSAVGLGRR